MRHSLTFAPAHLVTAAIATLLATTTAARDGDHSGISFESRQFHGEPLDVIVVGTTAYVGLDTGIEIFDVSAPAAPVSLGRRYLPSPAFALAIEGPRLYVANGESGLAIFDVANPLLPLLVGRVPTSGTRGVAAAGGIAYLAEASTSTLGVYGLRTVDVSTPAAPILLGFVPLANGALEVVLDGANAYVGTGSELHLGGQLVVFDVTTPASPTLMATLDIGEPVNGIAITATTAMLATGVPLAGSFISVDIAAPSMPAIIAWLALDDAAQDVDLIDDTAQVAAGVEGLLQIDIVDPADPITVATLDTDRYTVAVWARSGLSFLGERRTTELATLTAVDVGASLVELGTTPYAAATGAAIGLATAYLLRSDALEIFDTSDPANLRPLGRWSPPGADLGAISLAGSLVAISQSDLVRLLDVSDPMAPVTRGTATVSTPKAGPPLLDGAHMYVLAESGIEVFYVGNPDSPTAIGSYRSTAGWAADLAIEGGLGYLAVGTTVEVLDLGSPAAPRRVGEINLGELLYAVDVYDTLLVASGERTALQTIDVAIPASPTRLGGVGAGPAFGVSLYGTRALVAAGEAGLLVVDASDAANPVVASYYDTSGTAVAIANEGPTVYLATGSGQHWVLTCDTCPIACAVSVSLDPSDPTICEGESVLLSTATIALPGCTSGTLDYSWLEDGVAVPGAVASSYLVPPLHATGSFRYEVIASCSSDPVGCRTQAATDVTIEADYWPGITPNSLRAVGNATGYVLSWTIASGTGETNIHRTLNKRDLPLIYGDSLSLAGAVPTTTFATAFEPPTSGVAHYRVFGRSYCTGESIP